MAIHRRHSPGGVEQAIQKMVNALDAPISSSALGGMAAREMTEALPLYSFGKEDLIRGFDAENTGQYGWRSIVISGSGIKSFADIKNKNAGELIEPSKLTRGSLVDDMIAAAQLAERERPEANAELRVIESESLRLGALWLAGESNEFIPYEGAALKLLSEAEFRELAESMLRNSIKAFASSDEDTGVSESDSSNPEEGQGASANDGLKGLAE